ncbi:MAG: hypothetical protein M9962_07475 [Oligoflexia bacterium]|nr:hypothetical protein [Oligoflexia bacterium]
MIFLIAFLFSHMSVANFDGDLFAEIMGRPDRGKTKLSYEGSHTFQGEIEGTSSKLTQQFHALKGTFLLWQNYETKWKLSNSASISQIKTNARFPNGNPLPNQLWDLQTKISYSHKKENNDTIATDLAIGSNSNRPYGAFRDSYFSLNFIYHRPNEDESGWLYFLNLSNNRSILNFIPLPGFAYYFKAHENLRLVLGLPIFVAFWRPLPKLVTSISYFPVRNLRFKTSYFLFGPAQIFAELNREENLYRISDRQNKKERFFSEEWLAKIGAQMPLEKYLLGQISIGQKFQRRFFLGEKQKDRDSPQHRKISNEWVVEALVQSAF